MQIYCSFAVVPGLSLPGRLRRCWWFRRWPIVSQTPVVLVRTPALRTAGFGQQPATGAIGYGLSVRRAFTVIGPASEGSQCMAATHMRTVGAAG